MATVTKRLAFRPRICATLGYSFAEGKLPISDLALVDVARLSAAHMELRQLADVIALLKKYRGEMAIWYDLQGPKMRIDESYPYRETSVQYSDILFLCLPADLDHFRRIHGPKAVPLQLDMAFDKLESARTILIKDGSARLEIVQSVCRGALPWIQARACGAFVLRPGKSINIPDLTSDAYPILTKRDEDALVWGMERGADILCLSFVNSPDTIARARDILHSSRKRGKSMPKVWAKIETKTACENFEAIAALADGVVLGRGDLVPEVGLQQAVRWQWELLSRHAALFSRKKREFIVATHVLGSMKRATSPTVSELNDIWQCVKSGATGFLLATEVSVGDDPVAPIKCLKAFLDFMDGACGESRPLPVRAASKRVT